jgi:hypothetical protein
MMRKNKMNYLLRKLPMLIPAALVAGGIALSYSGCNDNLERLTTALDSRAPVVDTRPVAKDADQKAGGIDEKLLQAFNYQKK